MKNNYVVDLKVDDLIVNEPFLLHDLVRRNTKDGRPYLLCTLRDKTGTVNGVFWSVPDEISRWIRVGQVVLVTGRMVSYKDTLQVTATDMTIWPNPDLGEFLPTSQRPREEMVAELKRLIDQLGAPWQALASKILLDDGFFPRFVNAPAARTMHHAYVGGLLEHSLSMAALAGQLAAHYDYVNRDLLMTGALLHDLGKALEYLPEASFSLSDDGRLVGHIVRAIVIIEQAAAELGNISPEQLRDLIHLIASHHGTHEWGSPSTPKTLEAILLHQIDLLDSRVQGFYDHWRNDDGGEAWTLKRSPMHQTELRRPDGMESLESRRLDSQLQRET